MEVFQWVLEEDATSVLKQKFQYFIQIVW